jgi:hypothetical protein
MCGGYRRTTSEEEIARQSSKDNKILHQSLSFHLEHPNSYAVGIPLNAVKGRMQNRRKTAPEKSEDETDMPQNFSP